MSTKLVTLLISSALAVACGSGQYSGTYYASASVSTATPDLAYVAPGVYVIADYDAPIFYANGYYWYATDYGWYRSSRYTGGWVYAPQPPRVIAHIDRPYAYRHYRPHDYRVRNRPVPAQRIERPVVRDHRTNAARRNPYYRQRY